MVGRSSVFEQQLALWSADEKAKQAYFETVAARLEALELRQNHAIQITAEKRFGDH